MRYLKRPEIQVPLSFLIISILWIIFSDKFFLSFQKNVSLFQLTKIQSIKGCLFVGAVTLLIYLIVKSSSQKLIRSQEEYKELFYNIPNPLLILDLHTNKFCSVNKAAVEIYGYSKEEFYQMSVNDIRVHKIGSKLEFKGELWSIYEHKKKNGESIICIEKSKEIPFRNSNACLLSAHDITELEKAKADLTRRENQLNQILNSITDGFFILSPDLHVEKANELFKGLVEVRSDGVEGKKLSELLPSIKNTYSYNQYLYAIETKTPVHFESFYERKQKWYRVSAYPFDTGLSVFFADITREKEDEFKRYYNEQNVLALINNTEDLMWSIDCNFRYFIFNEPYRKNYRNIFGEDVWVGKTALNEKQGNQHLHKWKSLYERALAGEKFSVDMNFIVADSCHFTTVHFNPIYDADKNVIGAGCFLQDISERKLHEKRIEKQNEQLKRIAFITSHQVRVPLANILGLSEILDAENPLSAANCRIIEHIKTSAQQLDKSIINMVQQTVHAND